MSGIVKKAKPLIAAGVGAYVGFMVGGPSGALRGASIGYSLGSSKKPKGGPAGGMGSTNVSTPDTGQSATAIGEQAWVPKSFGSRRGGMVLTATDLDESPSLAPNGAMLMYATQDQGRGILAVVSIDGRVKYRLPSSVGDVREPAWSPERDR